MTVVPWPEGVFARYLTLAGATVDLRVKDEKTLAACTACPAHFEWLWASGDVWKTAEELAEREVRHWAQSHAGRCRALPKPDGAT